MGVEYNTGNGNFSTQRGDEMSSFLRDIKDLPDDDQDTKEVVILSKFDNDPREIVTMMNPDGHVVGMVRKGSMVYRVMIANKYRVIPS